MQLILIRHALPARQIVDVGVADPGLTDRGWEQSRRLAEWLGHEHIDHIVVSPRRRARETAQPLAERLGLDPEIVEGYAELDKQSQAYIPVEELTRDDEHKHILEKMRNRDWAALGYQDPEAFRREVVEAHREVVERHSGKRVAIVAHGGTINAIVSSVIQTPELFFFQPGYTSITRLALSEWTNRWTVRSLNEDAHLHTRPNVLSPLA